MGVSTDFAEEPDAEMLVSFDESDLKAVPIICVLRDTFVDSGRLNLSKDVDGFLLHEILSKIVGCGVNIAREGAIKHFHPETYRMTVEKCKWRS